ncbi:MAG: winged helix-turn-helix domain-containing protein, partial [Blastocatellia bacterium]
MRRKKLLSVTALFTFVRFRSNNENNNSRRRNAPQEKPLDGKPTRASPLGASAQGGRTVARAGGVVSAASMIEHLGVTISRDELLNEVWGYNSLTTTRTVDVHIS